MNEDYTPDLERFLAAQDCSYMGYSTALAEMRSGAKRGHWIWYIFPTIVGWAESPNHIKYGIRDANEAREYLAHPILGARLREITQVILDFPKDADPNVFMMWETDAKKLLASMTLFDYISPNDIFGEVCRKFFHDKRSRTTKRILKQQSSDE